jgi:ketosteroid isomerase-like protein
MLRANEDEQALEEIQRMKKFLGKFAWTRAAVCAVAALLILSMCSSAFAQKNKKSKDSDNDAAAQNPVPLPPKALSDEIDDDIGQMLAAFQVGNLEMMHKYYADNATFVSGGYDPPIVGWQNYAPLYQRELSAFQGMQLVRRNTFVFSVGGVAWATYEWEFDSSLNGQPFSARGQTTLIFNKVGANWLIVHNHTSEICPEAQAPPAAQTQPAAQPQPTAR